MTTSTSPFLSTMTPYVVNASSSSDEENAPEAFSLVQSKRNARTQDDALKRFQANAKEQQKERNRQRDRKLKERAEKTRKTKSLQEGYVQAGIKRAMRDVNEDMDEEEEGEEEPEDDGDEEGSENKEGVEGSQSDMSSEEDEDMESAEDGEQSHDDSSDESQDGIDDSHSISQSSLAKPKQNPQHLPDHLFISAFAAQTHPSSSKQKSPPSASQKTNTIKKRSHRVQAKDLIIG